MQVPFIIFLLSLHHNWFRSSMDRMEDSGSFDWGSSPHGITEEEANRRQIWSKPVISTYYRFFSFLLTSPKRRQKTRFRHQKTKIRV